MYIDVKVPVNIPTMVTELGERMMSELDDEEIISAVGSLDSDQWSDASSASSGLLHSTYYHFCPVYKAHVVPTPCNGATAAASWVT